MKKSSFIAFTTVSIALLTALASTLLLLPAHADGFVEDCVCDHWNENWENYANDTYTATAITGHYPSPGAFDYADFIFQSGYGGTFLPKPNYPTYCYWQWAQGINWYSNSYSKPYNYVYKQPWPGAMYYYVNEYDYTLYYSWFNPTRGLTQCWFERPDDPDQYWLCGSTWAFVSAS